MDWFLYVNGLVMKGLKKRQVGRVFVKVEPYLEPSRAFMMKLFGKIINAFQLFLQKVSLQLFDWVLKTPLKKVKLSI